VLNFLIITSGNIRKFLEEQFPNCLDQSSN
jgi:hypothetical protein